MAGGSKDQLAAELKTRQVERTVATIESLIDQLRVWGLPATFAYCTETGALKAYGSSCLSDVIREHSQEIFNDLDFLGDSIKDEPAEVMLLPSLDVPLKSLNFQECRTFATQVIRTVCAGSASGGGGGRRSVGWGVPERKPTWWPEDVPWTKLGLQSGVNHKQLIATLTACYAYFGQPLQIEEEEEEEADISEHHEITSDPELSEEETRGEVQEIVQGEPAHVQLPQILKPLKRIKFGKLRTLATSVVNAACGGGSRRIGWGVPKNKPIWWPEGVPWTTSSLQTGVKYHQLTRVITSCYAHFGQPLPDETNEEEELTDSDHPLEDSTELEPGQLVLPQIDKPLSSLNFVTCRSLATDLVRSSSGSGRKSIGWGKSRKRPTWWPSAVPWIKSGLQTGMKHEQLLHVIRCCYSYYGQSLAVSTNEDEVLTDFDHSLEDRTEVTELKPLNAVLPQIDQPLSSLKFAACRTFATDVVRAACVGRKNIGWGVAKYKPTWWPSDVPWIKSGLQTGMKHEQLLHVITSCYSYFQKSWTVDECSQEESQPSGDVTSELGAEAGPVHVHVASELGEVIIAKAVLLPTQTGAEGGLVQLPQLVQPLKSLNFQKCRTLATNVVRAVCGGPGKRVGWGLAEYKPTWWPTDAPWTKCSLQSGVNHRQLIDIITSCYAYLGEPLTVEVDPKEESIAPLAALLRETGGEVFSDPDSDTSDEETKLDPTQECVPGSSPVRLPVGVKPHSEEIFSSPDILEDSSTQETLLPQIDRPLNLLNFNDCRSLATHMVRAASGVGQGRVGWGRPQNKPQWWPKDVAWAKNSLRSGYNHQQLIDIISSCYSYFGQPLPIDECVQGSSSVRLPVGVKSHSGEEILEDTSAQETLRGVQLPEIDRPLNSLNFNDCRSLATRIVRASSRVGHKVHVGWGKPQNKPKWWPKDVAWTKNSLRSGYHHQQLIDIIRSCYSYFGQPIDGEMETAVSSIEDTEMATNVPPAEHDTKNNVTGPEENETEGAVTSETRFVTLDESVLKSFNLCGDDGQPNIVVVYSEDPVASGSGLNDNVIATGSPSLIYGTDEDGYNLSAVEVLVEIKEEGEHEQIIYTTSAALQHSTCQQQSSPQNEEITDVMVADTGDKASHIGTVQILDDHEYSIVQGQVSAAITEPESSEAIVNLEGDQDGGNDQDRNPQLVAMVAAQEEEQIPLEDSPSGTPDCLDDPEDVSSGSEEAMDIEEMDDSVKTTPSSSFQSTSKRATSKPTISRYEKRYTCNICEKTFTSGFSLRRHCRTHTQKKTPNAATCSQTRSSPRFSPSNQLSLAKGKYLYQCSTCHRKFGTEHALEKHTMTHIGKGLKGEVKDADRLYLCLHCDKTFPKEQDLEKHMIRHTGSKTYACDVCDKQFWDQSQLDVHMRIHTGEKLHACDTCKKQFIYNSSLKEHMRSHTGEKPYVCLSCNKAFSQQSTLKGHIRTHTGEKPFSCQVCSRSFTARSHLTQHLRTHTGEKPYICHHCGSAFKQLQHLQTHMLTHTGEKPYKCAACDKGFSTQTLLKGHMRIHTGEKPYVCTVCQVAFSLRSTLRKHMRVHTGERPYKCSVCKSAFTRKQHLQKHTEFHCSKKKLSEACEVSAKKSSE